VGVQEGVDGARDVVGNVGPRLRAGEASPGQVGEIAGHVVLSAHPTGRGLRAKLVDPGLQELKVDRGLALLWPVDPRRNERRRSFGGAGQRRLLRAPGRTKGQEDADRDESAPESGHCEQ
jgi:hypothetical protein